MSGPTHIPFERAMTPAEFGANLDAVRARIAEAAARAERSASEVVLLPVSKTVPQERIRAAIAAGCSTLGENKVQEAVRKHDEMADLDVSWALIGHLQRNKAREVAAIASQFHALDSLRVAQALDRRLEALGRPLQVYVQVNTSREPQKYGIAPEDLPGFLAALRACPTLQVQGLMTLAVFSTDQDRVRACFALLRELRDRARETDPDLIGPGGLSMGMSGDFETAVEEGATCVRVGQAIFGARVTPDSAYWPGATD